MTDAPLAERAANAYPYPLLIGQLLHRPRALAQEQEIVYADVMRYRYRDLLARLHRLAHLLRDLGLRPGATVAMMDWDSHRYLEMFFAVPMMGAVLQTVNVRLSHEQIVYTLNHAEADVVFVNRVFLPIIAAVAQDLQTVKTLVVLEDGEAEALPDGFVGEYEALLAASGDRYDFPDLDENSRATTFYTTGTTGLPKGVHFSHRQLVLHTLGGLSALAMAPKQGSLHSDDVYMPITPMFHVHAWGLPYIATLAGVKQVYPGRYMPDTLLGLKAREGVTFSHCVPTILQMLLSHPKSADVDLRGWKMIIGGSAMSPGLAEAAKARGIDAFTGYGMSETCPLLSLAQLPETEIGGPRDTMLRCKTGAPLPLVDLRVVDEEMADQPHDGATVGEVVARSPWLTQSYLKNAEQSEALWDGGYLHTQDIGHIDERGWLQITDRIKDVIKTGGEWLSSLTLENLLSTHPAVAEVAVIAVKHEKWGERPVALVVKKPGAEVTDTELRRLLEDAAAEGKISRFGIIERIEFVEELKKTSVGKLNKRAMRRVYDQAA
ncbi:MAG: fatty acid--CoA ligase [Desulfobulbaceae bacterium]|jgi:fatty-acyl-CoA synthase|nr:fatty acid--CoA ligase [Desulfobulbaceae bacterium]